MIFKPHLWQAILDQEENLRPSAYYTYPSRPAPQEYWIATHDDSELKRKKEEPSDIARIVRKLLTLGEQALGFGRDNKTAVMCRVEVGGRMIPIYFSFCDTRSTVSLEMADNPKAKEYLIPAD